MNDRPRTCQRPRPTERERQAAARVVARNRIARGEKVPEWIAEIARQGPRGLDL